MVSFRALRQKRQVIRFWIACLFCFKRKKLCFVARLCCMFKTKVVMSQPLLILLNIFMLDAMLHNRLLGTNWLIVRFALGLT